MPSTYTVNLGIEKPATGEQSGTWGDTTNTNFDILDQAINGAVRVTLTSAGTSGSPNQLQITNGAASDGRNKWIEIYSASDLGGSAFLQLDPNDAEKILFIRNSLAGSQSILLFQGTYNSGRDLEVPAGVDMVVKFDGGGASAATVTDVYTKLRVTELTTPTLTATTADINGGTLDNSVIGGTTAAAITGTTITANTSLNIAGDGATVTGIKDEDDMSSNSPTKLATQQSIKAYVDSQVGTVDTWAEVLANGATSGSTNPEVTAGQALKTNTINETSAGSGVTIDSVLLKDDVVNATDIETGSISANDGTASATIANSTGVMTIASSVLTTTDINGGSIDGTNIGASSAGTGAFTSLTSSNSLVITSSVPRVTLNDSDGTNTQGDIRQVSDAIVIKARNGSSNGAIKFTGEDGTTETEYAKFDANGVFTSRLGAVFNEDSADVDFRVESNNNTHALFVDAGNDRVGVLTSSPAAPLDIQFGDNANILRGSYASSEDNFFLELDSAIVTSGVVGYQFHLTNNGTAYNNTLTLDRGNVGIGVQSASAKLQVNGAAEGDTYFTGGTASSRLMSIFTSTHGGGANAGHNFKVASGSGAFIFGNDTTANLLTVQTGGIDVTGAITSSGNLTVNGADVTITANVIHSGDSDTYFGFNANDSWRVVTGNEERLKANNGEVVVNDNSADMDFRVESDAQSNMLVVDAAENKVGVNRSPNISNSKLEVGGADNVPIFNVEASGNTGGIGVGSTGMQFFSGSTKIQTIASDGSTFHDAVTITTGDNTHQLKLISTDADANIGPVLELYRDSASPADDDGLGRIYFYGNNSAGQKIEYGLIRTFVSDVTDATEDSALEIFTYSAGAQSSRFRATFDETVLNESSKDIDFRVESDSNTHMLFVDAGNNVVVVGGTTVETGDTFEVLGSGTNTIMRIRNTNAGDDGPILVFDKASASPANDDNVGDIRFIGLDSSSNATQYARFLVESSNVTNGAEDGTVSLELSVNGANAQIYNHSHVGTVFNELSNSALDFRVESDNDSSALFVDASADSVALRQHKFAQTPTSTNNDFVHFNTGSQLVNSSSSTTVNLFQRSASGAVVPCCGTVYVSCEASGQNVSWCYIIDFFYSNNTFTTTARATGNSQSTTTCSVQENGTGVSVTVTYAGGLGGNMKYNAAGFASVGNY